MRGIKNNLSKKFILSLVGQDEIFAKYFQLSVYTIRDCTINGTLINSPLRVDSNASFGFRYNNKGKLKARDFSGYFWGDCFDAVAYIMSKIYNKVYNVNNSKDFNEVLRHISITFCNKIYGDKQNRDIDKDIKNAITEIQYSKRIIEVVPRKYNQLDKSIWFKWGITISDLQEHNIYAVEQFYIDRYSQPEPKYYYTSKDPCYCYLLGVDEKGIYNVKLYFPLRNKKERTRYITNCAIIEGLHDVKKDSDVIIITESTKDRVAIKSAIRNLFSTGKDTISISVINYPSASYRLSNEEYIWLKGKLKNEDSIILSFFDFDTAGRKAAKDLQDRYNIEYLFLTRGELGLPNFDAKDFCELKEVVSEQSINSIMLDTLNKMYYGKYTY